MSGNPFSQEPILSQEEFRLVEKVQSKTILSHADILAQAKIYAEYADGKISTALKVMLKGSDWDEVMDGDDVWAFSYDKGATGVKRFKGDTYAYHWVVFEKGSDDDPEADEMSDSKPSDFPEYYLNY